MYNIIETILFENYMIFLLIYGTGAEPWYIYSTTSMSSSKVLQLQYMY